MRATTERTRPRTRRVLAALGVVQAIVAAMGWWLYPRRPAWPPRAELGPKTASAGALAFSPDGRLLAVGGWEGTVRLWDLAAGEERGWLSLGNDRLTVITSVAFSPDGATLAASGYGQEPRKAADIWPALKVWDVASREERPISEPAGFVMSPWFSADGRAIRLVTAEPTPAGPAVPRGVATYRERLALLDAETWRERSAVALPEGPAGPSAFSPDGRTAALGRLDGTVTLRDATTGRVLRTLTGGQRFLKFVQFSPDGRTLALGYDGGRATVQLWDVDLGRLLRTIRGPRSRMTFQMAFSPDGKTLATTNSTGGPSQRVVSPILRNLPRFMQDWFGLNRPGGSSVIFLWNVADGRERARLGGPQESISSLSFSPDGRTIAAGSPNRGVTLWDVPPSQDRQEAGGRGRAGASRRGP